MRNLSNETDLIFNLLTFCCDLVCACAFVLRLIVPARNLNMAHSLELV